MGTITPGPWVYEENAVRSDGIQRAPGCGYARPLVADVFGYGGLEEKAANIRAVCAVPEMIEALELVAGQYGDDDILPIAVRAVIRALKKAGVR